MHVIFVYFVRSGFRTKIKCTRKVQSKSENPQQSATVRKFHAYERLECPGYENWVRTKYSGFTVCPGVYHKYNINSSPSRLSAGKSLSIKPEPHIYCLSFFSADKRSGSGIYGTHNAKASFCSWCFIDKFTDYLSQIGRSITLQLPFDHIHVHSTCGQ